MKSCNGETILATRALVTANIISTRIQNDQSRDESSCVRARHCRGCRLWSLGEWRGLKENIYISLPYERIPSLEALSYQRLKLLAYSLSKQIDKWYHTVD